MHTPENPELEISQTVAEGDFSEAPAEGDEEEILYMLADEAIDHIFEEFAGIKCATVDLDHDGIEDLSLGLGAAHIDFMEHYEGDLPEAVAYMMMRTHPEQVNVNGSTEVRIVTDLIPYQWPEHFNGMFPTPIQIVLGTVEDRKLTPSVLQAIGTLNRKLENSIVVFEKL